MPKTYFTAKEVDQLIPKLEGIFEHIQLCKDKAEGLTRSLVGTTALPESPTFQAQINFWLQAIEDNVNYVYRLGGITKDAEAGLVDFPANIDGEDVWLCWKRGENRVGYWHNLDEGFSQRQSLQPATLPTLSH